MNSAGRMYAVYLTVPWKPDIHPESERHAGSLTYIRSLEDIRCTISAEQPEAVRKCESELRQQNGLSQIYTVVYKQVYTKLKKERMR